MNGAMKPGKEFFEALRNAGTRLLILDFDGTLAPFVTDRNEARPYPGVMEILRKIEVQGQTSITVISGRPLAELMQLTAGFPEIELWGSYGLERRRKSGLKEVGTLSEIAGLKLKSAFENLAKFNLGDRLEVKPFSLAIHYRNCDPEHLKVPIKVLGGYADYKDLVLRSFDGGIELMAMTADKGMAARKVINESQSSIGLFAVALGDDLADEEVFREVKEFGGYGILVRPMYRVTDAKYWLRPPEELLEFLGEWVEALTK